MAISGPSYPVCAAFVNPLRVTKLASPCDRTYQNHPTFVALRDGAQLGGKCGTCDYNDVCGGSRSRAFAVTGDPLAAEPDCVYDSGQTTETITLKMPNS